MLSKIKNFLSIFNWKEEKNKNKVNNQKEVISPTVANLKKYCEKQLPPLAWERIVFRTLKYTLQLYNKSLKDFQDSEAIPQNLQDRIQFLISEMYQKEITFGAADKFSHA